MTKIQIHYIIPQSRANGPNVRFVVFFQGCNLYCPNCINPHTHPKDKSKSMELDEIVKQIYSNLKSIEGVTITGGEPFLQAEGLLELLIAIQDFGLGIIISTGYEIEELERFPLFDSICKKSDIILAGRYHQNERVTSGLIGSRNKTLVLCTNRYSESDIINSHNLEIQVKNNSIVFSGTNIERFFNLQQL